MDVQTDFIYLYVASLDKNIAGTDYCCIVITDPDGQIIKKAIYKRKENSQPTKLVAVAGAILAVQPGTVKYIYTSDSGVVKWAETSSIPQASIIEYVSRDDNPAWKFIEVNYV